MKNNGFTLIELMIVIAVLGILAAIAVPEIDKIKESRNNVEEQEVEQPVYKRRGEFE